MHHATKLVSNGSPWRHFIRLIDPACVITLVLTAACHRAPTDVRPVERLAHDAAPLTLWAPDLLLATAQTDAYLTALTRRAGGQALVRMRASIADKLGFDPTDATSLQKAGLNPNGGLMLWTEPGINQALIALPCVNIKALDATLVALLRKQDGQADVSRSRVADVEVVTISRAFGDAILPSAHLIHIPGYAVIAQGEGLSALTAFAQRQHGSRKTSLAQPDNAARTVRQRDGGALPKGVVYAALQQPSSPEAPGAQLGAAAPPGPRPSPAERRVAASLRLDAMGLAADVRVAMTPSTHQSLQALVQGAPVGPLAGRVDTDAWAMWLTQGAGVQSLRPLWAGALAYLTQLGFLGPASAVLLPLYDAMAPTLKGPLRVSLHAHPHLDAAGLMRQAQRPRSLSEALQLVAVADIADAKQATHTLAALPLRLAEHGIEAVGRTLDVKGAHVQAFEVAHSTTPMAWAVYDDAFVWGLGADRLAHTLALMAQGKTALAEPEAGHALAPYYAQPGSIFDLRSAAIAHSIEAVMQRAAGESPSAAGLAALVTSATDVLRTLGDVVVGITDDTTQDASEPAMRVTVRQIMQ